VTDGLATSHDYYKYSTSLSYYRPIKLYQTISKYITLYPILISYHIIYHVSYHIMISYYIRLIIVRPRDRDNTTVPCKLQQWDRYRVPQNVFLYYIS